MARRAPQAFPTNSIITTHTLAILGEYTHTLDSLPLDLSRNFAEFRELDAVLSASMSSLIGKINQLTTMFETNTGTKEERLWLLADIAEEANRLKLGSEDKIRVACHAADGLRSNKAHMKSLLQQIPDKGFETLEALCRKTVYPCVGSRPLPSQGGFGEGGRRQRRGAYGSLLASSLEASPTKRKRPAGRDDESEVAGKTPRKERNAEGARQRNGPRNKRPDRATSPTESMVSVASHLPPNSQHVFTASHTRQTVPSRATNGNGANKRSRAAQNHEQHSSIPIDTPQDLYPAPPSSSVAHPSLPNPYGMTIMNEWVPGQLEGPGMPVARTFVPPPTADEADGAAPLGGEGEGEGDDGKTYCICNGVSYGEMIACDDASCETEWFHINCVGLLIPPVGEWYCSACREKRRGRRGGGRGGKKKANGGRTNARNTSA